MLSRPHDALDQYHLHKRNRSCTEVVLQDQWAQDILLFLKETIATVAWTSLGCILGEELME